MNVAIISGRLTRDPELDAVGDGIERVRFSVAVNTYNAKEKTDEVDFFNCSMLGKKAAAISQYFKKGDQIIVYGKFRSYKGKKEGSKDTLYWYLQVKDFDFGAKKQADGQTTVDASEVKAPEGFAYDPSTIPF